MPKITLPKEYLPLFATPEKKSCGLHREFLNYCSQHDVCTLAELKIALESGDSKKLDVLTYFDQQLVAINKINPEERRKLPQPENNISETKLIENIPAVRNTTTAVYNPELQAREDSSLEYLVSIGIDPIRKYSGSALAELTRIESLVGTSNGVNASLHALSYTSDGKVV
ncbi:MAG: hypothetical protein ABI597_01615 [Gammaproteobacteria bacterium]